MREEILVILSILPVLLAGIALIITYKKDRGIWAMGVLAAMALGALTAYGTYRLRASQQTEKVIYENEPATQENYLDVAYELMDSGRFTQAEKTLADARENCPYNEAYLLASARLYFLQGNDAAANALYALVPVKNTKNPYLSLNADEANADNPEKRMQAVSKAVDSILGNLPDEFFDILDSGIDSDQEETLLTDKRTAGYFSVPIVRETRIRQTAASGDYETFAESLGDDSDAATLLLAAEYSRNGKLDGIRLRNRDEVTADDVVLRNWIRRQEQEHAYEANDAQVIREILSQLEQQSTDDSAEWLKRQIMSHIMSTEDPEESKLYLELARMEFSEGNYDAAGRYLLDAIARAGTSEDPVYAGAAKQLQYVLQHPEDLEARKEVDRCTRILVKRILHNSALDEEEDMTAALEASLYEEVDAEMDSALTENSFEEDGGVYGNASAQSDFARYVSEEINQKEGTINILQLDKSAFPKLTAVVAADESAAPDAETFRRDFELSDCGIAVDDYQVSKMNYRTVNISLVCDNSGSMEGDKIENLKEALRVFSENLSGTDVNISIVPFNDSILTDRLCLFTDSEQKRREKIDAMTAGGGTSITTGLEYALGSFSSDTAMNMVIIMSDGQADFPGDDQKTRLRNTCQDKGITIYTMGLGEDVDQQVLSDFAKLGNGSYMYVSDAQSLLSFYNKIYRICTNRYQISYNAPDTMTVNRKMALEDRNTSCIRDEISYSLYENEDGELELGDRYSVTAGDVVINGLANRLFYKRRADQVTQLTGEGFRKNDIVKVKLSGTLKYDLESRYVDEHTIEVIIPESINVGSYNVVVTYNKRQRVFEKGLVMTTDDSYYLKFGDYSFTATEKTVYNGAIVLDGIVYMNSWLGFDGEVSLVGNIEQDTQILLSYEKAYRQFRRDASDGLGKYYADRGLVLTMPGIRDLTLYKETLLRPSDENYPVQVADVRQWGVNITDFMAITGTGMRLYPDRLELDFQAFDTQFPMQQTIMRVSGVDKLFSFKIEDKEKIIVNDRTVGCDLDIKIGSDDEVYGALGNMNIFFRKANVRLKTDTMKGEIEFGIGVDLAMLSDGLGLDLSWKEWELDGIKISADHEITTYVANVPITFSDFHVGVEDLTKNKDYALAGRILDAKWYGSADISAAKISTVFPGLQKFVKSEWIEDAAVAKLDDTKLSFCLLTPYIGVETTVNLLGILDIGRASIELGMGIEYTNSLIGMQDETINGMLASLTVGPKIETPNCKLRIQGTGELALSDKVLGVRGIGDVDITLSWWILVKDFQTHGEAFLGFYRQHNREWQFAVLAGGSSTGWNSMTPVVWPSGHTTRNR